jgi:hypothetical protein
MRTAVMLFTCDLRVNDHPALAELCATAEAVVALYVLDPTLLGRSLNRDRFLHQSLELASSPPPTSPDSSESTGGWVTPSSAVGCLTVTCLTTPATGNGLQAPATTPVRTGGSIRSGRPNGTTLTAHAWPVTPRDPSCPKEMRVSTSLHV